MVPTVNAVGICGYTKGPGEVIMWVYIYNLNGKVTISRVYDHYDECYEDYTSEMAKVAASCVDLAVARRWGMISDPRDAIGHIADHVYGVTQ